MYDSWIRWRFDGHWIHHFTTSEVYKALNILISHTESWWLFQWEVERKCFIWDIWLIPFSCGWETLKEHYNIGLSTSSPRWPFPESCYCTPRLVSDLVLPYLFTQRQNYPIPRSQSSLSRPRPWEQSCQSLLVPSISQVQDTPSSELSCQSLLEESISQVQDTTSSELSADERFSVVTLLLLRLLRFLRVDRYQRLSFCSNAFLRLQMTLLF